MSHERALGNIAIGTDTWPTRDRPKLERVKIDAVEDRAARDTLYMLAAFVFDLNRKMRYIFEGTKGYATLADPNFVRRVKADNDRLAEANEKQDYQALARQLEEINVEMYNAIESRYQQTVEWLVKEP